MPVQRKSGHHLLYNDAVRDRDLTAEQLHRSQRQRRPEAERGKIAQTSPFVEEPPQILGGVWLDIQSRKGVQLDVISIGSARILGLEMNLVAAPLTFKRPLRARAHGYAEPAPYVTFGDRLRFDVTRFQPEIELVETDARSLEGQRWFRVEVLDQSHLTQEVLDLEKTLLQLRSLRNAVQQRQFLVLRR